MATPGLCVASWTEYTLEQGHIERRMIDAGIEILARHKLEALDGKQIHLVNELTVDRIRREASVVTVTGRLPCDELYMALNADTEGLTAVGTKTLQRIGDCYGPATIAAAVYEGHRYARELDCEIDWDEPQFKTVSYQLELA